MQVFRITLPAFANLRTAPRRFNRDRRSAIAIVFALVLLPLIGIVGLAVDAALYFQARAALDAAVNGAALNALKIASAGELANDSNYVSEGVSAGKNWFTAMLGNSAGNLTSVTPSVTVTGGATVRASVTATATMTSVFGNLFGVTKYPVNVAVNASVVAAPYLEVVLLLDNSSSMEIGASTSDISTLSKLSPCDPSHAFYLASDHATWSNSSNVGYDVYVCSYGGNTYNGSAYGLTPCPVAAPSGLSYASFTATGVSPSGQNCQGILAKSNGAYPLAGPPCAFACHWTNTLSSDSRGGTADLFGMARRNGVTLRFDVVKTAAQALLQKMSADNLSFNNLTVGVYTFENAIKQIYPTGCVAQTAGCEAGNDFAKAEALVGTPPVYPSVTDTGILPPAAAVSGNNDDTAYEEDMTSLATSFVTSAGDGTTALNPKKVLMMITDGLEDDPNLSWLVARQAFESSYCTLFKNMGYTVYIAFTPYYPLPHTSYLSHLVPVAEGSGSDSISYQLQACATTTKDYTAVTTQATLTAALLAFLQTSLTEPMVLTK